MGIVLKKSGLWVSSIKELGVIIPIKQTMAYISKDLLCTTTVLFPKNGFISFHTSGNKGLFFVSSVVIP